ncbi:AAA family ATPase [Butyrivibrio fibrisolvens]|uniref:AAA family ATPase n=1 Tax=Butyrivibrio fibrisolvens TaxID=831 RepID=UPI0009B74830
MEKGVGVDNAVLILGESGTGKTVIANCFISATGRSAYVCKKSISGAEAVDGIVATFDDAMKNESSIVLIEGLDDYSRDNSDEMTEEFAVIQSFLDVPLFSIQLSFFIAMITMIINRIERA